MLRTDKPIYKVILVLNLLLIVVGVAVSIKDINITNTIGTIYTVLDVLALLFALFYIIYGYRKNAAGYYKAFGYLYLLSRVSEVAKIYDKNRPALFYILFGIVFVLLLVLVFGKDLGKKKSFILCGVIVLVELIDFFCTFNATGRFNLGAEVKLVDLDLACLYGILTYAKYLDKTERGTK